MLLETVTIYIEINCGSSSFNCSLIIASLKKQWTSSQSLNYYVQVTTHFLQTNDLVLKFCCNCPAYCFSQERSRDNEPVFQFFSSLLDKSQSFLLHILLNLKKEYVPCP